MDLAHIHTLKAVQTVERPNKGQTRAHRVSAHPHLLFLLFIRLLLQINRWGQVFPNWSLFRGLTHWNKKKKKKSWGLHVTCTGKHLQSYGKQDVPTWRHVFRLQANLFVLAVGAVQPGRGSQRRFPTDCCVCIHVVLEKLFLQTQSHTHT